ncbi:MAG: hypothetical protein RLZZ618_100 [Pseudomonadota bacterium]|jgi:hypothetical protein
MKPTSLLPVLALLGCGLAHAADPAAAADTSPKTPAESVVQNVIVEDEGMRVDELKVRGETQRITVQTKGVLKSRYEVLVPQYGRTGGLAGHRVWSVLAF